jgi:phosphoribosylformylglycinamidine cyclo-ligase
LARKVLLEHYDANDYVDSLNQTIGESLLAIHKSYLSVLDKILNQEWLVGISHITGGGIVENTRRILSKNQNITIDWNAWKRPEIFNLIQDLGNVPEDDMRHSMNLGIGLILIVKPEGLHKIQSHFSSIGESYIEIGSVC